jgi:O-antigen/teichoic acid export membrane protein
VRELKQGHNESRVLGSVATGFIGFVLFAVIGATATHFMAIHFGPEQFGLLTLALALTATAQGLTEFGQTQMLQRDIALTPDNEAQLIGYVLGLRLVISVTAATAFSVVGIMIYSHHDRLTSVTIVMSLMSVPLIAFIQILSTHFLHRFRNRRLVEIGVLQQLLYFGGTLLAIYAGAPIWACALSASATILLQAVILFGIARRHVRLRPRFSRVEWRRILVQAAPLGLSALLGSFYLKADILILGVMGHRAQLAYYGIAIAVCSFFFALPGLVVRVFMPVISRDGDGWHRPTIDLFGYVWTLGSLSVVLIWIGAPSAVRLFAGDKFEAAVMPLRILGPSVLGVCAATAMSALCVARGFQEKLGQISGLVLVLNVVANIVVIPRYGINGSALATTGCEFIGVALLARLITRNSGVRFSDLHRPLPGIFAALVSLLVTTPWLSGFSQNVLEVAGLELLATAVFVVCLTSARGLPLGVVYFLVPFARHRKVGPLAKIILKSDPLRALR